MGDEAFFQQELERDYADSGLRLLFAEWLATRGDPRAAGYRWLAELGKHPSRAYASFDWWRIVSTNPPEIRIPDELWFALDVAPHPSWVNCKEYPDRRAAEEAICRVVGDKNS